LSVVSCQLSVNAANELNDQSVGAKFDPGQKNAYTATDN
jgi:hypothetical protein